MSDTPVTDEFKDRLASGDSKPPEGATATAPAAPKRRFVYNGNELMDIDPSMTPEQIRDVWAGTYPELASAKIKGPDSSKDGEGNDVKTYTFTRNIGNLG